MRYLIAVVGGLACFAVLESVTAATLIEQTDGETRSIVYAEGAKLRTDEGGDAEGMQGYGLIDLEKKTFFLVNTKEKTVLDMSSAMWKAAAAGGGVTAQVDARLEKVGAGPEIAGYATEHYELLADGKKCQDIYLSRKAFDDSGCAKTWARAGQSMREMGVDPSDACDVAEFRALDFEKYGWPLKTMHRESMHAGQFEEVLRIERGVEPPPGGFEVPAGYQVVSFEAMMGSMAGQMGGAQSWEEDDGTDEDEAGSEEESYDEEYDEEEYDEEGTVDDAVEELGDRLKGFMDRFKKDD